MPAIFAVNIKNRKGDYYVYEVSYWGYIVNYNGEISKSRSYGWYL